MTVITTPRGDVTLVRPEPELLQRMHSLLPFGLHHLGKPQQGIEFGVIMQRGEREVYFLKQQPAPTDRRNGLLAMQVNSILVAGALAGYLESGFEGLLLPCAYMREKDGGMIEPGIAYLGCPSPTGRECRDFPDDTAFDRPFGPGFTPMLTAFIGALKRASRDTGLSLFRAIGLDVRPRMHLGSLAFGFMVVGPRVVCLKTQISDQDPTWVALRETGISEVVHCPSVPLAIDATDEPAS